jgi:hypothetical protein
VNEGQGEQIKVGDQGGPVEAAPLQFDKAEVSPAGLRVCAACQARFDAEYFEAGGQHICARCAAHFNDGSGRHLARAFLFGAVAALIGTIVWFAILKLSGSEFGLLGIAVGLFVGIAVRRGARGRGGARYQALAMALTYFSITASYVPLVFQGMAEHDEKRANAASAVGTPSSEPASATPDAPAKDDTEASSSTPTKPAPSLAKLLIGVVMIFGFAFAAPFLGGFQNFMGIIIIGIALYEAWKLNKRVDVTGPYRINASPA